MSDKVVTNAKDLYTEWSRARARDNTSVSLLLVLRVMHEYRNAMIAHNSIWDRLDAELPDGWDDPFTGCGHLYGDLIRVIHSTKTQYAHSEKEFYPRLSHNRYSKGSETFPIALWRKWIRRIQRDTKKLTVAIDEALTIEVQ